MWRYHTIHTIKRYGAYETLHKNWVKNPYKISNKKDKYVLNQMIKTVIL